MDVEWLPQNHNRPSFLAHVILFVLPQSPWRQLLHRGVLRDIASEGITRHYMYLFPAWYSSKLDYDILCNYDVLRIVHVRDFYAQFIEHIRKVLCAFF